jgi:hypothetical protein
MTAHGSPTAPNPADSGPVRVRPRPQWGWFVLFGLNVVIHQFMWSESDTIGVGLGLAITLGLVFQTRVAWVWGGVAGVALFAAGFWGPVNGRVVLISGLVVAVVSALLRILRARRRRWAELLAGPMTAVPAAVDEVDQWWDLDRPERVNGWAVLPDGLRIRFLIRRCPLEIYDAVLTTRTLHVYGEPRLSEVVVGLREGPVFAKVDFSAKRRHLRRVAARRNEADGSA